MANGNSLLRSWGWEILSVVGSASCLAALVGVLLGFDGKPIFTWHGVTLNAIVSLLSTASKAALLFAVGELVSQWKWILFTDRARPLMDFERIDSASRGLLGSLQLMWNCKKAWILRLGALIILLDVAVDPFSQQLVQLRQDLVYNEDRETILSTAVDPNTTLVTADADFSMQSAILFGLDQPLKNVVQQGAFNCPTGNCTWPEYESLAICNSCVDITDRLERHTTNIGLSALLATDNPAARVTFGGNTAFRLPNGLFIENDNGWVYTEDVNEGANDDIYGAVMMTTLGTGNASKTVSMQDLDTLIWAMSMIRVTQDPTNSSAAWPDLPHTAVECALHYCINNYSAEVKSGILQENVTKVEDAVRAPDSWVPETFSEPLREEVRSSIAFSDYWSAIKRTDLSLISPTNNTRYNISQSAVDGIGSYFGTTFASDLHVFVMPDDNTTEWQLNGYYMTTGQVQYTPSTMQVLYSTEDLNNTFTSLATSMSNALRDGSDATFNGADRELTIRV
ncbi:hypothetical protein SLS63_009796 [Diaporthe eres]|uniref:Carboxylic ester hydrolase n=1 Tax=Diaporthe eres TaxID=83184 RepID=A0ABR1NZ06_DIAER